jgi:hypothetical protein
MYMHRVNPMWTLRVLHGVQGVASSNPAVPTIDTNGLRHFLT